MASQIQRLTKLKEGIEQLRVQKAHAEGGLQKFTKELKDDFGCSTVKQAEKKLVTLIKERDELKAKAEAQFLTMEERYA